MHSCMINFLFLLIIGFMRVTRNSLKYYLSYPGIRLFIFFIFFLFSKPTGKNFKPIASTVSKYEDKKHFFIK